MPKQTIISCDHCGKTFSGVNFAPLMRILRKYGWVRGQAVGRYYCQEPECQAAREAEDARVLLAQKKRRQAKNQISE